MGEIMDTLISFGSPYWIIAAIIAVALVAAAVFDEIYTSEYNKFMYTFCSSMIERLVVKCLMALAFAATWPIPLGIIALGVVAFLGIFAVVFITSYFQGGRTPERTEDPFYRSSSVVLRSPR